MVQDTFCYGDHRHNDHNRQSWHVKATLHSIQDLIASAKGHRDRCCACTVRQSHHVTWGYSSPQYGRDQVIDEDTASHPEWKHSFVFNMKP